MGVCEESSSGVYDIVRQIATRVHAALACTRRKPYSLTADGRRYLEEQITSLDGVVKATQQRLKPA